MVLSTTNTDKIKGMPPFKSIVKHGLLALMFIGLGAGMIQTSTYLNFSIRGTYKVSNGSTTLYDQSGHVYLTMLGTDGEGHSTEESAWVELGNETNDTYEEMREGPFEWGNTNGKFLSEETDRFPGTMQNWRSDIAQLAVSGWTRFPFSPTDKDQANSAHDLAFMGNAEKYFNARLRKSVDAERRVGIGLFVIVVPAQGHVIEKIALRPKNSGTDQTGTAYYTFKSPVNNSDCNTTQCRLDFDDDFTHQDLAISADNQGWFGPPYHYKNHRTNVDNGFQSIPSFQRFLVKSSSLANSNEYWMMPAYSISPSSNFKSKECLGGIFCDEFDDTPKTWDRPLWRDVWGYLAASNSNIIPFLTGGSTTNLSAIDIAIHPGYKKTLNDDGTITSSITPNEPAKLMGSESLYALSTRYPRNELPVVLGLSWGFISNDWTLCDINGCFYDISRVVEADYQIYIEFAEKGYYINATSVDDTNGRQPIAGLIEITTPNKLIGSDKNLTMDQPVKLQFGPKGDQCIYQIEGTREQVVLDETGESVTTNRETTQNILVAPLDLNEALPYTGWDINSIRWNYSFNIRTFPPKFKLTSQYGFTYGEYAITHYIRLHDVKPNTYTNDITMTNKNLNGLKKEDLTATNNLNTQRLDGSAENDRKACGYGDNFLKVIRIEPNIDDYFYFDHFETQHANVYTYNLFDGATNPDITKYSTTTSANVQYATDPFTAYVQVQSTSDAHVDVVFQPFPTVTIGSLIDSNTYGRVTPNRANTNPNDRDETSPTRNLVFFDEFPTYYIQPKPDTSSYDSLVLRIDRKLSRAYIEYDNTPMVIFSNNTATARDNDKNKNLTSAEVKGFPTNTDPVIFSSSQKTFDAKISGNATIGYDLTLPIVNRPTNIYLDFIPYVVSFFTVTKNATPLPPTVNINVTVDRSEDILDTNKMNQTITARLNEQKALDVRIGQSIIEQYYISDIIEEKRTENGDPINDDTSPKSRKADILNDLKQQNYHTLQRTFYKNQYITSPIVSNTYIYIVAAPFKNIYYRTRNTNPETAPNGQLILLTAGLSTDFSQDELFFPAVTDWTPTQPHTVTKNGIGTAVGYREFDSPTFLAVPDLGYYVSSIKKYASPSDTLPDDAVFELLSISEPTTHPYIGNRPIVIGSVTQNIWLDIEFKEKPSIKTFWLGTDF